PERPKGADCKSAVIDFEGSNPSPTTIIYYSDVVIPVSNTEVCTCRGRVRSEATNNPSPTTILLDSQN
ncbi:hypothetical protein, partial [Citrobacter freundii]|uniref:hypothetical protein n=1 Tax=Citrobacter freundii TaxID=546 RepID=UPI001C431812